MFEKLIKDLKTTGFHEANDFCMRKPDFGSPMTIDSAKTARMVDFAPKSGKHHYLLIKNFMERFTLETLEATFSAYPGFDKVVMIPGSKNAYIKFEEMTQVQQIIEDNETAALVSGQRLKMCMVNKLPLDLNEKSRILLITVYNEKIEITVKSVHEIFKDFAKICKMIIFKKKNYQIFSEFESADDASFFKEAFHSINYKGLFFLKIQFTQKNSLIVNSNNLYEHDFTKDTRKKLTPHSIDFILNTSQERPRMLEMPRPVNLSSVNQLDERNTSYTVSPPKLSPSHAKRLYLLKVSNLNPEVKHKTIFNLFSLYGNIEKITLDPFAQSAYVYFGSEFDQITVYHYLNCVELFGKVICLDLLKEPEVDSKSNFSPKDDSNTVYYAKTKAVKPEDVQNKQRTIYKPSSILYVFNLSRSVSLELIKTLFEGVEQVSKIYYVNDSKNSALCFFDSIEAAIHVLCSFKNMNVVDKSLKINFANESLVKASSEPKYKTNYFSLQEFDEKTKFSGFFRVPENLPAMADKPGKEKSRFAFNEFKLF